MEEVHLEATRVHSNDMPPGSPNSLNMTHEPPSIGVDLTEVVLQPGETLIVYHPHSWCPMRVVPTAELYSPTERAIRNDIKNPEDTYAPFPTKADFKQAEIFIDNNCSDRLINDQLKFVRRNGIKLKVKTARKMHELLAGGVGEDTDDSQVGPIQSTIKNAVSLTGYLPVPSGGD